MLSIKQAQTCLRYWGYYYRGKVDGISGSIFKESLKKFQKKYGLKVTGKLDKDTSNQIEAKIKQLQNMMYYLGYDVKVTGVFNSKDKKAVQSIQRKLAPASYKKFAKRGIIDSVTWNKIKNAYKKKKAKNRYFFQKTNGVIDWKVVERHGFKKSEFKCHCGGKYCNGYPHSIDPKLIYVAIKLRRKFGAIEITSGERCPKWNSLQSGSSSTSTHMLGKAMDFVVLSGKYNKSTIINYCYKLKHVKYSYSNSTNMGNAVHVNV